MENFTSRTDDILEYAAEVSEETYLNTRDFIRMTHNFIATFNHYRLRDVLEDVRFKNFHEELKRLHTAIEQEVNKEIMRYKKQ
jgi:hypothetical protein